MRVRVSIGNLVLGLLTPIGEGDYVQYVGILSASLYNKKGQKRLQPIGGAAELTEEGQKYLEERFGAEAFHKSQEGHIDARFEVDDSHLREIFDFFRKRDPKYFEIDPRRELVEELSTVELKGNGEVMEIPPVLTPDEAESIQVEFVDTVEQPFSDGPGTSSLAKEGVPSRRLFHRFNLVVSHEIFRKMEVSDAIRLLTETEVLTAGGGAHKGITGGGIEMADNFIL